MHQVEGIHRTRVHAIEKPRSFCIFSITLLFKFSLHLTIISYNFPSLSRTCDSVVHYVLSDRVIVIINCVLSQLISEYFSTVLMLPFPAMVLKTKSRS